MNSKSNLFQICKNEPHIQIIKTVYNYVESNSKSELLKNLVQESSKNEVASKSAENAHKLAETIKKSVADEENLRAEFLKSEIADKSNLQQPDRALADNETKQIGKMATELNDNILLEKYQSILSNETEFAVKTGETSERIKAKSLLAQAENIEFANKAIESVKQIDENEIEVELNSAGLIKTGESIKTADMLEHFASKNSEEYLPKFTLEEIQRADEIIARSSYLQGSQFDSYIRQQHLEAGNEIAKQLQKPLTPEELQYINNFKTTNEMNQRFTQIQQSENFHNVQQRNAEISTQRNYEIQTQPTTIRVVNPSESRDLQEGGFWANERQAREAKIAEERIEKFENSTEAEQIAQLAQDEAESSMLKRELSEVLVMS